MKVKLHCALGTLGLTLGRTYRDLRFDSRDRSLHLFVNNGSSKSWYMLRGTRWHLLRREDCWGTYRGAVAGKWEARRTPPLFSRAQAGVSSMADRAWQLREQLAPYMLLDWYGQRKEVMSYPVPNANNVSIMLRNPNDPTTLEEVVLEEYL